MLSRSLLPLVFLIVLTTGAFGSDFTFRKTNWGMTKEQVRSAEELKNPMEKENLLAYKTNVLSKNVYLVYEFINGKLGKARYVVAEEHSNKNNYITDYNSFVEALTKKYGKPMSNDTLWTNDLYRDDPSERGFAVSLGHLLYQTKWGNSATDITAGLFGENYNITCFVEYSSVQYRDEFKARENKKSMEDL